MRHTVCGAEASQPRGAAGRLEANAEMSDGILPLDCSGGPVPIQPFAIRLGGVAA